MNILIVHLILLMNVVSAVVQDLKFSLIVMENVCLQMDMIVMVYVEELQN